MPIHVLSNYDHSPDGVIYATHGALTVSATDVRYIKALCTLLSNIFLLNSIISLHIHFACRTRQSLVPLCLLLTAKSASRFILCYREYQGFQAAAQSKPIQRYSYLLPLNPLDHNSQWGCHGCSHTGDDCTNPKIL